MNLTVVPPLPHLTHFSLTLVPLCDTRQAHPLITEAEDVTCPDCLERLKALPANERQDITDAQ